MKALTAISANSPQQSNTNFLFTVLLLLTQNCLSPWEERLDGKDLAHLPGQEQAENRIFHCHFSFVIGIGQRSITNGAFRTEERRERENDR